MDLRKWDKQKFEDRTEDITVEQLAPWYPEGADPVWTVRALTGEEFARVTEAKEKAEKMSAVVDLIGGNKAETVQAMKLLLGIGDADTPGDHSARIEALLVGTVSPKDVQRGHIVKLAREFPLIFRTLSSKVIELTGMGRQPKKSKGSGPTPVSETP